MIPILNKRAGFTLVELVITITLLGIAVTGILLAILTAVRYSGDPMITYQAIAIGESYLEEIVNKNYPASTPCPGSPAATRSTYDDICDYNQLTESPHDQTGAAVSLAGTYSVHVDIDTTTAQLGSLSSGTQALRIDVTVTPPSGSAMTFSAYRTNYQ